MHSWVDSGSASIMVQSSRLHLDPTCGAKLDTLKALDCSTGEDTSLSTTHDESSPTAHVSPVAISSSVVQAGEIGGITVGVVVIILLILIIMLLILMKFKPRKRYNIH